MPGAAREIEQENEDLQHFCALIKRRAGISLSSSKHDLVRTRLRSRLTAHGFKSYREYRRLLDSLDSRDPEWELFTNLLTTNKTDFFREPKHFEYLVQSILPAWLKSGQKTFKVWSAASSTGEEVYTLAMVLSRSLPPDRDFKILGTDIDTSVLQTAQNAVYSVAKKHEIPAEFHNSCLDLGKDDARGWFRIKPHLKDKVVLKPHNLMEATTPGDHVFDLVLCRNVLIYFNPEGINFVQKKLHRSVKPGGYLFIGHSESFQGLHHDWLTVGPSVFKKAAGP